MCGDIADKAPMLLDYICGECRDHFESVKEHLHAMDIEYTVDGTIVRGLDYYTKTVFEFKTAISGTAGTVCGGGRYDGLIEELGGASTPGIGFAMGIERIIMALSESENLPVLTDVADLFIANIGDDTKLFVTSLTDKLRKMGIKCERDLCARSLKAQMKYADKCGARYSIVIGSDEAEKNSAVLKNMENKEQITVSLTDLTEIKSALMKG